MSLCRQIFIPLSPLLLKLVFTLNLSYAKLCSSCNNNLNHNTPGVKKWPRPKKALLKRSEIELGSQDLLLLIGLKNMTSLQNIVISGAQGLLMLMGSKFFKDDQAAKHLDERTMFCSLVIFIKNFDAVNIRRPWAPEIIMFCSEVMMIKLLKAGDISRSLWFHFFSTRLF